LKALLDFNQSTTDVCCCAQGVPQTTHLLTHEQLLSVSGVIECELPNRHVYAFIGNIRFKDQL